MGPELLDKQMETQQLPPPAGALDDDDLRRSVLCAVKDSKLVPITKITATVVDGWLSLEGEVDSPYQKQAVEAVSRAIAGILGVSNNITTECETLAERIQQNILDAFVSRARRNAERISIAVHDHIATLSGYVPSEEEHQQAISAAWSTVGAAAVIDHLRIAAAPGYDTAATHRTDFYAAHCLGAPKIRF